MIVPQRRKRASHTNSHAGCRTCRDRRVKCDETRPFCNRCTKSGRVCNGYKTLFRPSIEMRSICPRPLSQPHSFSTPEGQALSFFRDATLNQLPCAWASETPWCQVSFELVYQQPMIAAAAAACASLHRSVIDAKDSHQSEFALQQYCKSMALTHKYIRDLQSSTTDDDVVVVLVACLLFFTYEVFSGQDAKASLHLRTGLRIIHERCCPREEPLRPNERHAIIVNAKPKNLFDLLVHTFIRLDSDYYLTGHDDPFLYPVCKEPMPAVFSTPEEANVHLEAMTARIFDFFDDLYDHVEGIVAEHRDLESLNDAEESCLVRATMRTVNLDDTLTQGVEESHRILATWNAAFTDTPRTEKNMAIHISTQVLHFCIFIWVNTWRDPTSTAIDRFEPQFEHFTARCEQYLELHLVRTPFRANSITDSSVTPPAFSLGSSIVGCLVWIVEQCRTSTIRRRCIATLQKINLKGVFDTGYLVAYLQAIVDYEEQAARKCNPDLMLKSDLLVCEIPEAARLLEVVMSPSFHDDDPGFYKRKHVSVIHVTKKPGTTCEELQLGETIVSLT